MDASWTLSIGGCSNTEGTFIPGPVEPRADGSFMEIQALDITRSGLPVSARYATMRPEPEGSPRNYLTKSVLIRTCRVWLKGDRFTLLFSPPPR